MTATKQSGSRPPLEINRSTFWDGQSLLSRDLNNLVQVSEDLQWWHNRAIHNAYGICDGLEVTPELDSKTKLPVALHVAIGIAYDSFGRALLHSQEESVALPRSFPGKSVSLALLLRYPQPAEVSRGCEVPPACCLGQAPRTIGWADFVWKDAGSVRSGDGVPLARVTYSDAGDPQFDGTFPQPRVRPYQRPHLIADKTVPGSTSWALGPVGLQIIPSTTRQLFWQPVDVLVDTSAAGFSGTPCYFASLSGPLVDFSRGVLLEAVFPHIVKEFRDHFTFRFWIPSLEDILLRHILSGQFSQSATGLVIGFPDFLAFARKQKLCVSWLGCEMPPDASLQEIMNLSRLLAGCGALPGSRST